MSEGNGPDADLSGERPVQIDRYSVTTSMLEMRFRGASLSMGSGFFWKAPDETIFLVTNWHNVTGINPLTGEHISPTAAEPDEVMCSAFPNGDINSRGAIGRGLYHRDGYPIWLEHPVHGRRVDVVCVPMPADLSSWTFPMNSLADSPLRPSVANDVFILGYPRAIGPEQLPIWKRGSIATEPDLDVNGLPLMYVDSASSEGMSGSPVIMRNAHGGLMEDGILQLGGIHTRFLGIYSGRLLPEGSLRAQLGFVWKARVIEEIIAANQRGQIL